MATSMQELKSKGSKESISDSDKDSEDASSYSCTETDTEEGNDTFKSSDCSELEAIGEENISVGKKRKRGSVFYLNKQM